MKSYPEIMRLRSTMQYFLDQLGVGMVVEHKKFGEGVIAEMEKGKIWIAFEEGTKSF